MLPKSIDVNAATYKIIVSNRIPSIKGLRLDGLCCSGTKKIWVRKSLPLDDQLTTFWHEVLHALDFEYGIPELSHDAIYQLEQPLNWFIQDNPQLYTMWLSKKKKNGE
jgi:hypothetical protein